MGKFAHFYFVFSHHNSSEPEEKIKKREELYRFACPDKRELDDIVEGTQVNCLKFAEPFLFFSFNSSRIRLRLCKHWWNSLLPKCPEKGLICFTISEAFLCKIIHRQSYREKYPSIQAKKWKVFCYLRITHASSAVWLKLDLFAHVPLSNFTIMNYQVIIRWCENTVTAGDCLTNSVRLLNTKLKVTDDLQ